MITTRFKRKSKIPPELTVHPVSKKIVCGAWRKGKKAQAEKDGITEEMIIADKTGVLFDKYRCKKAPLTNDGWNNGRCAFCGGNAGRPPVNGKYRAYIPEKTTKRLTSFTPHHENLLNELNIMSDLIGDKLKVIYTLEQNEDSPVQLNTKFIKLFKKIDDKLRNEFDIQGTYSLLDQINKELKSEQLIAAAKQDLIILLDKYKALAAEEYKRRALSGEYVPRSVIITEFTHVYTIVAEFISDQEILHEINKAIVRRINTTFGNNAIEQEQETHSPNALNRFNDSSEGSIEGLDTIEAEFSTETL